MHWLKNNPRKKVEIKVTNILGKEELVSKLNEFSKNKKINFEDKFIKKRIEYKTSYCEKLNKHPWFTLVLSKSMSIFDITSLKMFFVLALLSLGSNIFIVEIGHRCISHRIYSADIMISKE